MMLWPKGHQSLLGGGRSDLGGTFVDPTILTNVSSGYARFLRRDFWPRAPLFKFETEEEVVQMANDTEFGLAAYFLFQRYWPGIPCCRTA